MTNSDVIALATAGLGDEIVIAKINAAPATAFDTSVDGLKALKAAGVSIEVVKTMISPGGAHSMAAAQERMADLDDFNQVQPVGLYAYVSNGGTARHLMRLAYVRPTKMSVSGGFSPKMHADFAATTSSVEFSDTHPVFYIYPKGDDAATLKDLETFQIVKLTVNKDSRDFAVGDMAKGETDEKIRQPMKVTHVKYGIYRVETAKPLDPGEYMFYDRGTWRPYVGPMGGGDYFEFGVTGAAK